MLEAASGPECTHCGCLDCDELAGLVRLQPVGWFNTAARFKCNYCGKVFTAKRPEVISNDQALDVGLP